MEKISNLISLDSLKKQSSSQQEQKANPKTAEVINWLFKELRSNFPAFKQAWPNNTELTNAKKTWLKAFMLAGISSIEQLQYGLNRCYLMEKPFVPSPGEFISWCTPTPKELGLPSYDDAFDESCKNSHPSATKAWTHDVVYYAWSKTGSYDLCNKPSAVIRPKFDEYYKEAIKLHTQGKILRQIENNPPPPKRRMDGKPMTREQAMAAIGKMIPIQLKRN
jgi:hypothetical protein